MTIHRALEPADRPRLDALLRRVAAFTDDERAVALELVDHQLANPSSDDYRFILAFADEDAETLAGYLCFGRTPMTAATYDLYWLATAPEFSRSGVARGLVGAMERAIVDAGGGIVRVETGSREGHGAAVRFYDAVGFHRAATIEDFYAPGDDLIVFTHRVAGPKQPERRASAASSDAALYDAAIGYRDAANDRGFLLACAERFGARPVRRVTAWASGPGRHLVAFASAGIAATGVDPSEAMNDFARALADARGNASPEIRLMKAGLDERVDVPIADLSFVPLSAIHALASADAIARHLEVAAASLAPGGVHVIEATHPSDLAPGGVNKTEWTEVRGSEVIDARFRIHTQNAGLDRVVPVTLEVVCSKKNGGGPKIVGRLKQEDRWLVPDLEGWKSIVARAPEFEIAATLGDLNVDVPFEHSAAWRLVLVLRRR